ncbi:ABC transporter substrate-binding protein [Candidatus Halobeggiatoa sp. HSG11]|nr:ABC transporter substrate-binding protein [Candidatus Halobeggiatoa sp. HSG11]
MFKQICFFSLIVIGLYGCQGENDVPEPRPVQEQFVEGAYNIGMAGRGIDYDILPFAAKQINNVGGILNRQLNVVRVEHSHGYDRMQITQEMLDIGIQMFVGGSSATGHQMLPLVSTNKTPLILGASTSPSVTTLADNDYVFRIPPSDVFVGQALAQSAIDAGAQTCTMIYHAGDSWGKGLTTEFQKSFEVLGGKILINVAIPEEKTTGFATEIDLLYSQYPDCVFYAMYNVVNIINEAAGTPFNGIHLYSEGVLDYTFIPNLTNYTFVENSIAISPGYGRSDSVELIYFTDTYRNHYGFEPGNYEVMGYDAIMVAALAIEHAGLVNNTDNPTGEMIRDSLRHVMNPPGEIVGPSSIGTGLQYIRNGIDVDFTGAYSATDWDSNGDVVGELVYTVFRFSTEEGGFVQERQTIVNVPLTDK